MSEDVGSGHLIGDALLAPTYDATILMMGCYQELEMEKQTYTHTHAHTVLLL